VDWVSNVAMLELVVTLFLGLLLKVDMIDAEDAESELFTAIVVLLSTFVFFYPMISIIIASERTQKAVVSVFTKLRAKVFTWKKKQNKIAVTIKQDVDTDDATDGSSGTPDPSEQHVVTIITNDNDGGELGDLSPSSTNMAPSLQPRRLPPLTEEMNEVRSLFSPPTSRPRTVNQCCAGSDTHIGGRIIILEYPITPSCSDGWLSATMLGAQLSHQGVLPIVARSNRYWWLEVGRLLFPALYSTALNDRCSARARMFSKALSE
jgi:hypothetical protein